jgi:hypothetical protein
MPLAAFTFGERIKVECAIQREREKKRILTVVERFFFFFLSQNKTAITHTQAACKGQLKQCIKSSEPTV